MTDKSRAGRRVFHDDGAVVVGVAGLEVALRELKRRTEAARLAAELRRREGYASPGARRRKKHRAAVRREARRQVRQRLSAVQEL